MSTSVVAADERVADVAFSDDSLTVSLMDGRSILRRLEGVSEPLQAASGSLLPKS